MLREQALARIQGVQTRVDVSKGRALEVATDRAARHAVEKLTEDANSELKAAREILRHEHRHRRRMDEHVLAANTHNDMAHNLMLRPSGPARGAGLRTPAAAAGRRAQEAAGEVRETGRDLRGTGAVGAHQRAHRGAAVSAQQRMRARSFDRTLTVVVWGLAALAIAVAVAGALWPRFVPLCFTPENHVVCPTRTESARGDRADEIAHGASRWDYLAVEVAGVVAAAVASAMTLGGSNGTAAPVKVPLRS
ncbi:hypothetical protein E1265_01750 [Streptomyces sp. 8K308]|uniref:hypothetical protein n=1 Tax=Streptomyces sp. 8K308 TaxID=2530388 RepID=UPI001044B5D1|nr:hypothetical protein [Streptomyces sp. 8K308]TDC27436.1 hypothetical protein E1265_01750 [Streptomyces sp. 8K308]